MIVLVISNINKSKNFEKKWLDNIEFMFLVKHWDPVVLSLGIHITQPNYIPTK